MISGGAAAHGRAQVRRSRGSEALARQLEEAPDRLLLAPELLADAARVLGGALEEVLQAALGVVGQRVDARDVLLRAGDPHRRLALRQRARAAHRGDDDPLVGRDERGGQQPVRGEPDVEPEPAVDAPRARCARSCSGSRQMSSTVSAASSASRSAQACSAYSCSASSRSSAAARSRSQGRASARRPPRRRPPRGRRGRRRSGSCRGRAGRGRRRSAPRTAAAPHDPQRDRCRCVGVDQRSAEQLVGWMLVHAGPP